MPYLALSYIALIALAWILVPHPALGVALAALPIAILGVVRNLFWLILLFVIFSFFRVHEVIPALMPFKLPLLLSLGALSSIGWHLVISRQLKLYWHHSLNWLVLFWTLVTLGLIFASNRDIAWSNFSGIYWKIMVMTLATVWVINDKSQLTKACWAIIIAGGLVALVANYNAMMGIGLVEGSRVTIGRQIGSMLGDPNDLALVLLFPFAFSLSIMLNPRLGGFSRFISTLVVLCLFTAIIATQSRGGLLGMLSVCAVFGYRMIRSKVLFFSLGALGGLVLYVVAGIGSRASGGAAEAGIDASAMGRLYAWEAATKMALENPFTGVGLNNFYVNYFFYSSHWDGLNHAVHSTWFGVLAETGFLGLLVFIILIVSLIRTAYNSLQRLSHCKSPYLYSAAGAVYAGMIGTVVSGTFLTQGFVWPIYILAALIVAISRIVQNDSQNEKTQLQLSIKAQ